MTCSRTPATAVLVLALACGVFAAPAPPPAATDPLVGQAAFPGRDLPIQRVHRYRMDGRIRPLLFWISRDDVGLGSIVWRADAQASAWELLIGSDPSVAPRGLNRWGYIAEEAGPRETRVLGVMSSSEESSLQEVVHTLDGGVARGRFKAIEASVQPGSSSAAIGIIETERDLTIHDVSALLERLNARFGAIAARRAPVPPGARPGFLSAVAECLHETALAWQAGPAAIGRMSGRTMQYVYGRGLFDLTLRSVEPVPDYRLEGAPVSGVLRTAFEIRDRRDGDRYRFELTYGTAGEYAEVPLVIKYQPKWWLEVRLVHADSRLVASLDPATGRPSAARAPAR